MDISILAGDASSLGKTLFSLRPPNLHLLFLTSTAQLLGLERALGLELRPTMFRNVSFSHLVCLSVRSTAFRSDFNKFWNDYRIEPRKQLTNPVIKILYVGRMFDVLKKFSHFGTDLGNFKSRPVEGAAPIRRRYGRGEGG